MTAFALRANAVSGPELPSTTAEPSVVALGTTPLACGAPFLVQCSGVVVGARTVLTAAHCVEAGLHTGRFQVLAASAPGEPFDIVDVESTHVHDGYARGQADADLAVIVAARPLPTPPAKWSTSPPQARGAAEIWGFGAASAGEATAARLRGGSVTLSTVAEGTLRMSPAPNMLCDGDSGGGLFVSAPSGRELVGILSQGDSACDAWGLAARVDDAFVARWLAPQGSAPSREAKGYDRLCSSPCAIETDCPAGTRCLPIGSGSNRCVIEGMPPGDLVGGCANASCDACVQLSASSECSCFRACETPPAAPPTGCSTSRRRISSSGSPLTGIALFIAAGVAVMRFGRLRRQPIITRHSSRVSS